MTNMKDFKKFPYGVSDFANFQDDNLYYVDKTQYIPIIERKGNTLVFIRPRRFGKSLFLSTLGYYYDILKKDRFDTLFQGTYIHQHPTAQKNSYLVLYFDFSVVDKSPDHVENSFFHCINNSVQLFFARYREVLGKDFKAKIKDSQAKRMTSDLLTMLFDIVREKELKIYAIIDEFDTFASSILATGGRENYWKKTPGNSFYRAFFNLLKNGTCGTNAPLGKLFISGVTPITLDELIAGFNTIDNISMDPDLNEMTGFTITEVETMINYYRETVQISLSTPEVLEIMSKWYSGYRFADEQKHAIFNSTQVIYFFMEYLKESKLPRDMIDINVRISYKAIRELILSDKKDPLTTNDNFSILQEIIETGSIESIINKNFPVEQLTNRENFISLLFFFGLLSIRDVLPENKYLLAITNEANKHLYYDYMESTYQAIYGFNLDMLKFWKLMEQMAFKGEWQPLVSRMVQEMRESFGSRDLNKGENAVQVFLNVYLGQSKLYIIHSEKELNKGFANLVMEPCLAQFPTLKYAYVIELKYLSTTEKDPGASGQSPQLEKIRRQGEAQLRLYAVDKKFEKTIGKTTLVKLLLIFRGFELVYMEEVTD